MTPILAGQILGKLPSNKKSFPVSIDFSKYANGSVPSIFVPSPTWSILNGKAINTPIEGSDLFDPGAGTFAGTGTYSWTAYGTNTIENDTNTLKITYADNPQGAYNYLRDASDLTSNLTLYNFYKMYMDTKVNTGSSVDFLLFDGAITYGGAVTATVFESRRMVFRAGSINGCLIRNNLLTAGEIAWYDNLILRPLTNSQLVLKYNRNLPKTSNVSALWSAIQPYSNPGVICWWDGVNAFQNCLVAWHNGGSILYLDKYVGTTRTNLILSVTTPFNAAKAIKVVKVAPNTFRLLYGVDQIGVNQTVSDAEIINNGYSGLVSADSSCQCSNFSIS